MAHADALSRNLIISVEVNLVNINEDDWMLAVQQNNDRCKIIMETLQWSSNDRSEKEIQKNFKVQNRNRVLLRAFRRRIVVNFHESIGHMLLDKTVEKLYWFPGMPGCEKKRTWHVKTMILTSYRKDGRTV